MFIPVGTEEAIPRQKFPFVTTMLVALNSLVFLFEFSLLFNGSEQALDAFILNFGFVPAQISNGQSLYTLLTAMFVHGSLMHVGFNMLYLLAFGDNIEDRLGHFRYLVFYLAAGLLASLVQVYVNPGSQIPNVGASGAIAGMLGAYLLLFPKGRVRVFFFLGPLSRTTRISALLYIGFWFIMQFFSGLGSLGVETAATGGVAYWAHIGGFAAGFGIGLIYRLLKPGPIDTFA
jgi:membrane associated rhomboid family serine protease